MEFLLLRLSGSQEQSLGEACSQATVTGARLPWASQAQSPRVTQVSEGATQGNIPKSAVRALGSTSHLLGKAVNKKMLWNE